MKAENDLQGALQRTARLEQQLAWRTVTPEQKKMLRDKLLSFSPTPLKGLTINIEYLISGNEAEEYACELKSALNGLGTEIHGPEPEDKVLISQDGEKHSIAGVAFLENWNTGLEPAAENLILALDGPGVNINPSRSVNPDQGEHVVTIYVGIKPPN